MAANLELIARIRAYHASHPKLSLFDALLAYAEETGEEAADLIPYLDETIITQLKEDVYNTRQLRPSVQHAQPRTLMEFFT